MGRQESGGERDYAKHFDRTRVYTGTRPSTAVKRRSGDTACQAVSCRNAEARIITLASRFISTMFNQMIKYNTDVLNRTFAAIVNTLRRGIMTHIANSY